VAPVKAVVNLVGFLVAVPGAQVSSPLSRSVDLFDGAPRLAGLRRIDLDGSGECCSVHLFGFGADGRRRGCQAACTHRGCPVTDISARPTPSDLLGRCRGPLLTAPLSVHQVMINGHAPCPRLFFAHGCDPRRPGTAVKVERPHRSEDERPGRPTVSGTAWRRPPRSRNVADRRPTDAPDPPYLARSARHGNRLAMHSSQYRIVVLAAEAGR